MPMTESQRRAQKRWREKNKERLTAYKAEYWQQNKHRWLKPEKPVGDTFDTKPNYGAPYLVG